MEFASEYDDGEEEKTPTVDDVQEDEEKTIIIDIGQATTKVGFAGDTKPLQFPTVVGKPKYQHRMAGVEAQELYVGDDTVAMRGILKLEYPINRGQVMNWDHYYSLLNHIFYNLLRVNPRKCNVIYIVPPLTPPDTAIYFARVLFETHQCKSVAIIDSATTSVFSVGETTGLCVEIGEGLTTITPVLDGRLYPPSIQRINLAGVDILNYLQSLLSRYGITQKREILREIKEKACKISMNPDKDSMDPEFDENFVLPDGETLKINAYVSVWTGEVLFQPGLLGYQNMLNLPQAIIQSIMQTHQGYWRKLLKKIVFAGGTTKFRGLKERLEYELEQLLPQLGPLPEEFEEQREEANPEEEDKKLVQIKTSAKDMKNCPKCGELLDDPNSKFCPYCGAKLEIEQLDIIGLDKQTYPNVCPNCKEPLDGVSPYCPYCGTKLEPIIIKDKVNRKEKKILKKGQADEEELSQIMEEVSDEYGDVEELIKLEEELEEKNKIIRIITSDHQQYAGFMGASILGALPSFKKFLITYEQFQRDPNSVLVDFSHILSGL